MSNQINPLNNLQYFDKNDFYAYFENSEFKYNEVKLITTDTYDENAISITIDQIGKSICGVIAIQLAIIGLGNKNYGKVTYMGKEHDIKQFFDTNNIIYNAAFGSQLAPEALTPRRLIRFFRFLIRDFILETGRTSYLYRKYCPNIDIQNAIFIYPGSEHNFRPESDIEKATLLIQTYMILDSRQPNKTLITERIKRVLLAKGFNLTFLEAIKPYNIESVTVVL